MKNYLKEFLVSFEYPEESHPVLLEAYDKISENSEASAIFDSLMSEYDKSYNIDYKNALEIMKSVSAIAGVHEYTGALLLFICYSKRLKQYYIDAGLDLEIYKTSLLDLRYKIYECHGMYGIWGAFVAHWFPGFFYLDRFGFCKLEFEIIKFNDEYEKDGVKLSKDSKVINVHIPRTGTRLDEESRKRSYAMAAEFFAPRLGGEPVIFVCSSWLLYPDHENFLPRHTNTYGFFKSFDIFARGYTKNRSNLWRLFDTLECNPDKLPADTSLRRAYVEHLRRGGQTGWGRGVRFV